MLPLKSCHCVSSFFLISINWTLFSNRNFSWNWAAYNFYICKQKHCKSGFSKRKVLKDSVCLVTGILSRIFCSLYYTFHSQSLYYSLIFLNPALDYSSFWEVLWIVGITDFILKFLFMGLKCLFLLVPSFIMPFKSKGYWYMLLEELCITELLFPYQFGFVTL